MKIKFLILSLLVGFAALTVLAQFQSAEVSAESSATASDSIVQLTAEAAGLPRLLPEKLPRTGTYWEVLPNGFAPLPSLPLDLTLPIYGITDGIFLVDATHGEAGVKARNRADAVAAQGAAVADLIERVQAAALAREFGLEDDDEPPMYGRMYSADNPDALWQELTNVANGLAFLNLNNGTNLVYRIEVTTNLLTPWQVELILWPTNADVMPFTLPTLGRQTLLVRAQDWTFVDSDTNSLPDWWELKYFGQLGVNPSADADGDGASNLQEYQAGSHPLSTTMVLAWGNNSFGECNVPAGLTNAVAVDGGGDGSPSITSAFSVALKADGRVVAWGDNARGQTNTTGLNNVRTLTAGAYHGLALHTNGTVSSWGSWKAWDDNYNAVFQTASVPSGLSNVVGVAAAIYHDAAVFSNGAVRAWSYFTNADWLVVPTNLPPAKAVAAGADHTVALLTNGRVAVWGDNTWGQTNLPGNLSNVVAIAAGYLHTVALKANGTVVAWGGDNADANFWGFNQNQSVVPAGLSNVVAIAASLYYSLAEKSDGTVVMWGNDLGLPNYSLNQISAIGSGWKHALAVRSGLLTPILLTQPVSQTVLLGGTASFGVQARALAGATYQWQLGGVNLSGATNPALTVSNATANASGNYRCIVNSPAGSTVSSNALLTVVLPPAITAFSPATNQTVMDGTTLTLSVSAIVPGGLTNYPISYQWRFNGADLAGATATNYTFKSLFSGAYSVQITDAAGSTNLVWHIISTNAPVNVTNDLLLIYNTNSADSTTCLNYYLAHRPNVGGANVLGIGYTNPVSPGYYESITPTDLTNRILNPVAAWLTNNPSKRPQYVVLFMDLPGRVCTNTVLPTGTSTPTGYIPLLASSSVCVKFRDIRADWQPYVTHLNMGMTNTVNRTNDCIAYINKLAAIGVPISSNSPVLSASLGNYGNTNYALDGVRASIYSFSDTTVTSATNSLLSAGVAPSAIQFFNGVLSNNNASSITNHCTTATNLAGYVSWGANGYISAAQNIDGTITWHGNSGWYLMQTIESYNGEQIWLDGAQGTFTYWFCPSAYGGTNYSNTPVGAVSTVDEPGLDGKNNNAQFFGLWAQGKNFGVCAWVSRGISFLYPPEFQATGDPLVIH